MVGAEATADPTSHRHPRTLMNTFVAIFGALGLTFAYVLGLWLYKHHVEQKMLEFLARKWRDDKDNFDLWMYNLSIKVTKKDIHNAENEI
jgi:hypothetical protein